MTPLADIQAGQELGHYRIDALVSATGIVSVFRATDLTDGRTVAIKVPNPVIEEDLMPFDRFKREEEIGARMDHPNIMRVYPQHPPHEAYFGLVRRGLRRRSQLTRLQKSQAAETPVADGAPGASRVGRSASQIRRGV